MAKPSFDEFQLALLFPERREDLGILLTHEQATALIPDERATRKYYDSWTPTFARRRPKAARVNGTERARRVRRSKVLAAIFMVPVVVGIIVVIVYAVMGAMSTANNSVFDPSPTPLFTVPGAP